MGRIQTSIGLITGTPIAETVDQLIEIAAAPRDRLQKRVQTLAAEQTAVAELTALVIGVQLAGKKLASSSLFQSTKVASSAAAVVSATRTGTPSAGRYSVRTLKTAATQSFASAARETGRAFGSAGTLRIRGGGFVDNSVQLATLNGGRGVARGSVQITDRSGSSAVIDLSQAETVDDVLNAINSATGIRVRATVDGDAFKLVDRSGSTASNLIVREYGGGNTAADLGLAAIDAASSSATGADIYRLSGSTSLSSLRDSLGVRAASGNDIDITFRDSTTLAIDVGDYSRDAGYASGTTQNADPNAVLTLSADSTGGDADGLVVRLVNDPSVTQGSETVQLLSGSGGDELVVSIDEGFTTANDVVAALQADATLAAQYTFTAGGDGTGVVSSSDTATLSGGAAIAAPTEPTIEDLLRVLNDADPTRLSAQLSADGDSIVLNDLTGGGGSFVVADAGSSTLASDLGLAASVAADTVTGAKLLTGLRSISLSRLAGGAGISGLTSLDIQTRNGTTTAVDVSTASSLQDVINAINDSAANVEAGFNDAGTGLSLRDLSGGSLNDFSVSSADTTAADLGLATSTTDTLIQGDDLQLQFVDMATRLDRLNLGKGVDDGAFQITDSDGQTGTVNLASLSARTVGDVVDAINDLGLGVAARINDSGDGVLLTDTANGSGTLAVTDLASGTAAADLGIAGSATNQLIGGQVTSAIDGAQVDVIRIDSSDTLATLAEKIRTEARFATAASIAGADGTSTLQLMSSSGGRVGRVAVKAGGVDLSLNETIKGQDAKILVGDPNTASGTILTSADGVFDSAIDGVSLTVKSLSDDPVTVDITDDPGAVTSAVQSLVDQYNNLVTKLDELTFFDEAKQTTGLLFGSTEALRIETGFSKLFSGRVTGAGEIRSLERLGLSMNEKGKLDYSKSTLQDQLETNGEAVSTFFSTEDTGFAAQLDALTERLAGVDDSLLISRGNSLRNQVETNNERIEKYNERLESERQRLLNQFYAMEAAIAKIQSNQSAISSIQPITMPQR